ncbi:hypothetical protein ACF0H5_014129 [Mactra antiquata]
MDPSNMTKKILENQEGAATQSNSDHSVLVMETKNETTNEQSEISAENILIDIHGDPSNDIDTVSNGDYTSTQPHDTDQGLAQGLNISHTESGYLTDSIISRDTNSVQGATGSNPNSEQEITPVAENLITFSTSSSCVTSSVTSPISDYEYQASGYSDVQSSGENQTSPDSDDHEGQVNRIFDECTQIINKKSRIEQLDTLAKLSLSNDRQDLTNIDNIIATNSTPLRPESLVFQGQNGRGRSKSEVYDYEYVDKSDNRKRSKSSAFPIPKLKEGVCITEEMLSKSLPHGKLAKSSSGLIEFIADDLQEKIRMSSPLSKTASSNASSRRSSMLSLTSIDSMASSSMATSMTSGMSRSYPQSPDGIPPIDPMAVHEVENQARLVADSLDLMMGNLRNSLHQMSAISVGCEDAYKTSVDVTCDSVDASIKSMYALMAKCEELSYAMQPVYKLADQIKEIKRLLDKFESQLGERP